MEMTNNNWYVQLLVGPGAASDRASADIDTFFRTELQIMQLGVKAAFLH